MIVPIFGPAGAVSFVLKSFVRNNHMSRKIFFADGYKLTAECSLSSTSLAADFMIITANMSLSFKIPFTIVTQILLSP